MYAKNESNSWILVSQKILMTSLWPDTKINMYLAAQSSLIIRQTCTRIFGEYRNENEDFLTKFLFCLRNVGMYSYVSNKRLYSFIVFKKKIHLTRPLNYFSVYASVSFCMFVPYPFIRDLRVWNIKHAGLLLAGTPVFSWNRLMKLQ